MMRKSQIGGAAVVAACALLLSAAPVLAAAEEGEPPLVHYRPDPAYLGDIHPYYADGTHYLFSLTADGTYSPELATSADLVNWEPTPLTHTGPAPAQNYYALGLIKDGSVYRSWYGNGGEMRSSESTDLTTWSEAAPAYRIPNNNTLFPAGARDPYVFWDPDVSKYRMVSTAYRTNQNWGIGTGMDVSIALTTSTGPTPNGWEAQEELIRYPNTGVAAANGIEPEVTQFFKSGDRWYLMTSFARQSIHFVGRATYFIGDAGATIDDVDWASKAPHYIDGEDIAAAQVYSDGERNLFMGWIPRDAQGNFWGGHLSFPREITARPDGTLDVALASDVEPLLEGQQEWPAAGGATITGQGSGWTVDGQTAQYTGGGFATAVLPVNAGALNLSFTAEMSSAASRAGLLIGEGLAGPLGIEVTLDKQDNLLRLRYDQTGSGGWVDFASTPVRPGELVGELDVRVLIEGDMIELFVDDRYSLAARVPFQLANANVRLLAVGNTSFSDITAYQLSAGSPTLVNREVPTIQGTPDTGQTLTATPGEWKPAGGGSIESLAFSYQWLRDGEPISGATGTSYSPQEGDQGLPLTVAVTAAQGEQTLVASSEPVIVRWQSTTEIKLDSPRLRARTDTTIEVTVTSTSAVPPSGTVTVFVGAQSVTATLEDSKATLNLGKVSKNVDTLIATYSGDDTSSPSATAVHVKVR